jgi:hypothetical protein
VALVPKGPSDLTLYNRWLTRAEQRVFDADELEQELHARHYQRRQKNLGRQSRLAVDELTALNADIDQKITANDSPRLEDALEDLFSKTKDLSLGIIEDGYGRG